MFNFIVKTILILTALLLAVLILFFSYLSLSRNKIQTGIDKCYETNNNLLLSNINKMAKEKSGKKQACLYWQEAISSLDQCIKEAYKIPGILMESTATIKNIRELKDKQIKTCADYPETVVNKDNYINFKLFGKDLILNLTPLVQLRGTL